MSAPKQLQRPEGHANGRSYQGIGKHDAKGQAEERTSIDGRSGVAEVKGIEVRVGTVLGHERLLNHDVLTPRAAQTHDLPVVVNRVITAWH